MLYGFAVFNNAPLIALGAGAFIEKGVGRHGSFAKKPEPGSESQD